MLPHVVRWNAREAGPVYAQLLEAAGHDPGPDPAGWLAERLRALAAACGIPRDLKSAGVLEADLPGLAELAAAQWTGRFNPRPFDREGALHLYREAY
jgi:alcohol dehydrogenase class IV